MNQARAYKASPSKYAKDAGGQPYTSTEFNKGIEAWGFSVPNTPKDTDKNKAEWDKIIAQIQSKWTKQPDIRTKMVKMQNLMVQ